MAAPYLSNWRSRAGDLLASAHYWASDRVEDTRDAMSYWSTAQKVGVVIVGLSIVGVLVGAFVFLPRATSATHTPDGLPVACAQVVEGLRSQSGPIPEQTRQQLRDSCPTDYAARVWAQLPLEQRIPGN